MAGTHGRTVPHGRLKKHSTLQSVNWIFRMNGASVILMPSLYESAISCSSMSFVLVTLKMINLTQFLSLVRVHLL